MEQVDTLFIQTFKDSCDKRKIIGSGLNLTVENETNFLETYYKNLNNFMEKEGFIEMEIANKANTYTFCGFPVRKLKKSWYQNST